MGKFEEIFGPKNFPAGSYQEAEQEQLEAVKNEMIKSRFENAQLFADDDIPAPVVCLEIVQNGKSYPIATTGNFSTIIGKAKSRKTFALTAVLAAALIGRIVMNMISTLQNGFIAILFDTEQSRYDVKRCLDRIIRLAGLPPDVHPDNLMVCSLRAFDPKSRLEIIEHAIENTPNLGFVVIDGIRDLVTSINDEEQATMITSKLLRWTEEKNIHIMTVLHENKGDSNARGHLGTEMTNKGETVISITKDAKDKNISVIECNMSRQMEFEPFAFTIDETGLPVLADDFEISNNNQKSLAPDQIAESTHRELLEKVFKVKGMMMYSETWQSIKDVYKPYYKTFGNNKAMEFLTYFQSVGLIKKNGKYYMLN